MKKLLVVMLLLYPLSALAVTYEWTDESGTVNFAEDLGKVPKKYRKKARTVGDTGGAPEITEITEPVKGKPKGDGEQNGKKQLYAGKDENAWRKEFLASKYGVQQSESELSDLRGRLTDTSKMSRSEYLAIQNTIKNAESRLEQQQKRADQLRESADRLGVPMQWRQ